MIHRVRGTTAAARPFGVSAPKSPAAASAPHAPVAGLRAALNRVGPSANHDTTMGAALTQLASAKAFGSQFSFIKMDEATAVSATLAGLRAINALVGAARSSLHGFEPRVAFRDELGRINVRYTRTYDGLPIFGCEVIAHLKDGQVVDLTGGALPADLAVRTTPRIAADSAADIALHAFAATPERTSAPQLVVAATDDGIYHLAYHVVLAAYGVSPRRVHYFVDAHSGELISQLQYTEHQGVRPNASSSAVAAQHIAPEPVLEPGTGSSVYSGVVKLTTTKVDGKYILRDPTKHNAETRDAHNTGGELAREEGPFVDDNDTWGEASDSPRVHDAVDAQYGATNYLRYLKDVFGRDSMDDKGKQLISYVHVGTNYDNAYWDGTAMNYGDGNGREYLTTVDTDTCGHECTHGVTENSCNLIYRGESGALNEAGSDIIGACGFSWFLRGMKDSGILKDYLLFEDSFTADIEGDAIRYINDPMRDTISSDNYASRYRGSSDGGGVHRNSGIANNFFYLLAAGGVNKTSGIKVEAGIGIEKALRIYYRAHTVYFTPNTDFAGMRAACLKAATDLFGADSKELATVKQAATAVGINDKGTGSLQLIR